MWTKQKSCYKEKHSCMKKLLRLASWLILSLSSCTFHYFCVISKNNCFSPDIAKTNFGRYVILLHILVAIATWNTVFLPMKYQVYFALLLYLIFKSYIKFISEFYIFSIHNTVLCRVMVFSWLYYHSFLIKFVFRICFWCMPRISKVDKGSTP